jgi:hypothetical protein
MVGHVARGVLGAANGILRLPGILLGGAKDTSRDVADH